MIAVVFSGSLMVSFGSLIMPVSCFLTFEAFVTVPSIGRSSQDDRNRLYIGGKVTVTAS